jgi:hypothetical protein
MSLTETRREAAKENPARVSHRRTAKFPACNVSGVCSAGVIVHVAESSFGSIVIGVGVPPGGVRERIGVEPCDDK